MTREALAHRRRSSGGFTLVELIVVVTILGILAAVVVFSVSNVTTTSQNNACSADASTIRTAVSAYQAKNGSATTPSMANLVSDNDLQQPSTLFNLTWPSGVLTLTGTGGCVGKTG